jgi:hypothetical protein
MRSVIYDKCKQCCSLKILFGGCFPLLLPLPTLHLPPFPPLLFEWGSGGLPRKIFDICSQVSFSEFWVLN